MASMVKKIQMILAMPICHETKKNIHNKVEVHKDSSNQVASSTILSRGQVSGKERIMGKTRYQEEGIQLKFGVCRSCFNALFHKRR